MEESVPRDWRPRRRNHALAICAFSLALALGACGSQPPRHAPGEPVLTPGSVRGIHKQKGSELRSQGHVVRFEGAGVTQQGGPQGSAPSPGAPSDKQVRADLALARRQLTDFKAHLDSTAFLQTGPASLVLRDGTAPAA